MEANIQHQGITFKVDLSRALDISIPLRAGNENVNAWYVEDVKIEAVESEFFIGDVNRGGSVNFRNISFNPHGNGTHTECVGHISKEDYSINKELKNFFFIARLVTIHPEIKEDGDKIITAAQINSHNYTHSSGLKAEAVVLRTLPNEPEKINRHYSNTNPAYIDAEAIPFLTENGIDHILIDLPSVDREFDDGKLNAHHAFWQYPQYTQAHRTITEMVYVPDAIEDGFYLLNLQIAAFENDATPSKPVLFRIQ